MGAFVSFHSAAHNSNAGAQGNVNAGWQGTDIAFGRFVSGRHDESSNSSGSSTQSAQATHLVFTVQPTDGTAGTSFTVTVTVEDSSGNTVTGNDSTIRLRANGPGGLTGSRTLTATAVDGVATFNNVVLNTAGAYTLVASSRGAGRVDSNSFTISPDTTDAVHLAFLAGTGTGTGTNSNSGCGGDFGSSSDGFGFEFGRHGRDSHTIRGTAGQPLSTFRVVEEDKFGNIITSDSTSTVTLAINTGPSGDTLDSSSTLTATVVDGVATFDNVILDTAGTYTLNATDSDSAYPVATSGSIKVKAT